jgi:hypothetical protein
VGTDRSGEDALLYRELLADATFHNLLLAFDADLAETARAGHCPICGGVLHSAKFARKPRGRACTLGAEHELRFSFCGAGAGCRKRETPPSLRFLGAKVYLAVTVVLIAVMRHGATVSRVAALTAEIGVDRRTIERWRRWWSDSFTATSFWQAARALLIPPVEHERLPASLVERFPGRDADRIIALLRFIAPITGGRARAS